MAIESFGIEKESLRALLEEARLGRARLPEFQRGWVWPMENMRALLASISLGYPAGTIMMLRTGGDVRFKHRSIQGATPTIEAQRLILDGQQRLTSLFQALLLGKPIETENARKSKVAGWFYIDIVKALDPTEDREEAFVFVPVDKKVKAFGGDITLDVGTPELEFASMHFPVHQLLDAEDWIDDFDEHWHGDESKRALRRRFRKEIIDQFKSYQMPVIELSADTPRQAVCQVFEKVNTGGVTLTVFELLTATFAADEFDLRKDWESRRLEWAGQEYRVLREVSNTDFLQAIALLTTAEARANFVKMNPVDDRAPRVGCRRSDILNMPLDAYQRWAGPLTRGFRAAAKILHQQYIFETKYLPYGAQLIPLAAILTVLQPKEIETAAAQRRIAQWLWCGILGEQYGGTTETRFGFDLPEVVAWVRDSGPEPRTVAEAQFAPSRLDRLRTRGSAAYKGIYALLMKNDARDWRSGEKTSVTDYFAESIEIHHMFPVAWCKKNGVEAADYNLIANKTPLTGLTNRIISGRAPSVYLPRLAKDQGVEESTIENYVRSHAAEPSLLASDDFRGFIAARRAGLLNLVADAMGKPVDSSAPPEENTEPLQADDDLDDE